MNFFAKISLWIVRVGLFLTLAVPLVAIKSAVFPYSLGKIVFFQIIIEFIFPFFLYLALRDKAYRPRRGPIFYALVIYFIALFISAIFGVDWWRSFWGYRDRMDGLFTMLHFFAFFVMLTVTLKTKREWFWFWNVLLFTGFAVVLSNGLMTLRAIGNLVDFFGAQDGGLIGNVIFYAGFVLSEVFVALFLFSNTEKRKLKIFYFLAAGFFALTVFISAKRGAMIAALAVAFLAIVFWFLGGSRKRKMILILCAMVLVAVLGGLFLARNTVFVSTNPVLGSLTQLSPTSGTAETRLFAWRAAWRGWLERPVLGWGYINFYVPFNKYYNPKLLSHSVYETWFDRAHNIVFEHLATTGVLGLTAYLALLGSVIFIAAKSKEEWFKDPKWILGLGLAAYFIQNLFSIDSPSSYLMLFIIFAYLARNELREDKPVRAGFSKILLVFLAALFSGYLIYNINLKSYEMAKDELYAAGLSATDLRGSVDWYRQAFSVGSPYAMEAKKLFVKTVIGGIERESFTEDETKMLLSEAKDILDAATLGHNGWSAIDYYLTGRLYSEWGKFDSAYFSKAEDAFKQALELSPSRQQIYYGYGRAKILEGKPAEALPLFKKMVELNPDVAESHWYLGLEYNELGMPEAIDELVEAWELGYSLKTNGEARLMIEVLARKNQFEKIPAIYNLMISWSPADASLYGELAALYAKLGEKDRARTAAMKAMELDASFAPEGKIFLKSLGF